MIQERFMSLIYPPVCTLCRKPCVPVKEYPGICRLCLASMPLRKNSGEGIYWPEPLYLRRHYRDRIFGCALYAEPLRKALIRLKIGEGLEVAAALAPFLIRTICLSGQPVHAVISVPLHQERLRERGYNQSECLSNAVAEGLGCMDYSGLLIRVRNTGRQSEQTDRQSRLSNLAHAFTLKQFDDRDGRKAVFPLREGQTIWLIDDVVSTGATLAEAAVPLWQTGVRVNSLAMAVNLAGSAGSSLPWPELNCLEHQ